MNSDPRIDEIRLRVRRLINDAPATCPLMEQETDPLDALKVELAQLETQLAQEAKAEEIEQKASLQFLLRTALESMVEGVIVVDMEGNFIVFNEAAQELMGQGPKDTRPENWSDEYAVFMADGTTPFPSEELPLRQAMQGKSVREKILVIRAPQSSKERFLSTNACPVFNAKGKQIAALAAIHDITESKLIEQELRKAQRSAEDIARAKSHFLANMSHEIRTPITAVIGFADLLLDHQLSASDRLNYVQTIRRNGEHLLALINDVLDLSKIEAEKMHIEKVSCSLPDLLQEVTSLMQVYAHNKKLDFEVYYETPIPAEIDSDPIRLRQILLNLVSNAIKFTLEGGVKIVARCCDVGTDKSRIEIEVNDTGIGLEKKEIDRLFQSFHQANVTTTRQFGGTGLGLAICQPLAEALGGVIDVHSTPGKGSTFALVLHQAIDGKAAMVETPRKAAAETSLTSDSAFEALPTLNGHVLLAEDGHDNQILLSTILRGQGLKVVIVENGEDAVSQAMEASAKGEPFDVVLMDMQMPRLDGYGASAILRNKGYSAPIIALTAHAMPGERERCLAAGCDDYLSKPVSRPVLVATIQGHIRRIQGGETELTKHATTPSSHCHESPLHSSYANDPDMAEIIMAFVERLPLKIRDIKDAAEKGDMEFVGSLAHQLKGSAGGYGFMPVSEVASEVEDLAKGHRAGNELSLAISRLASVCDRIRVGNVE